ncbi:carboxypeptidase N subunit 2-like [Euwallacea similis]|uniref:carboxypeptidase N subunit 2-like n=1 Tax=Euwallacea similis TaxID=1736056 RepID=UPI00344B3203
MLWLTLTLLLVVGANCEVNSDDFEQWVLDPTKNASESLTLCEAEGVRVKKYTEELDLRPLTCATNLTVLIVDGIGLKTVTNKSLEALPKSVQNLSIVNNNIRAINGLTFANLTTKHLNLSSNNIELIDPTAFDFLTALELLNLDNNKIAIFNFTFVECPKLKMISMKHNLIKKLSEGTLKNVKHNVLTVLLSYNQITEVHKSAFDVKQFHEVHLDHNQLGNAQLLIRLVKAELVDLSQNNITCLPKEFMENGLSKIKTLNLTGNPLECHCLHDLRRKMRKNVEFQKMSPLVQNINLILPKNDTTKC